MKGGEFNLKEAQSYIEGHHGEETNSIWENIWSLPQCPKIKTFLWLVLYHKFLTWENLVKIGFIGALWCYLCKCDENLNHLLNTCRYVYVIWD